MSALQINDCCTTLGHAAHSFFIVYRRSGDYYMRGHFFKIEKSDVRRKWAQWAHTYTTDKKKNGWFMIRYIGCNVLLGRAPAHWTTTTIQRRKKKHISILRCSRIKITNERNKKKKRTILWSNWMQQWNTEHRATVWKLPLRLSPCICACICVCLFAASY